MSLEKSVPHVRFAPPLHPPKPKNLLITLVRVGFLWMKTRIGFPSDQQTSDVSECLDETLDDTLGTIRVCVRSSKWWPVKRCSRECLGKKWPRGRCVVTGRGKPGFLMRCEVRHEPPCDQGSAWLQVAGMLLPLVEPAGLPTVQSVSEAGVNAAAVYRASSGVVRASLVPGTGTARGTSATSTIGRDAVATQARRYRRQAATL